ncbi:hypothetical protein RND71_020542 [Anisodus tanguticus]|uniref:Uncharacterized protein n=1 Tax=Anisodus tanguticus TaxID=243964 RepID=A0AAE1S1E2_9SOLA|nr:hypothetical protein RND71_020542 [Anisodus tanguticus]
MLRSSVRIDSLSFNLWADRRNLERRIRRLEKQQRTSSVMIFSLKQCSTFSGPIFRLYASIRSSYHLNLALSYDEDAIFFPKNEKCVPLFSGGDEQDIVDKRCILREQIKANIVAAAASGKDLEETGSEDDELHDLSDEDADDESTDKSASNTPDSINRSSFRKGRPADSLTGNSGNISSNSDARKPKRKRRPKKKKQQVVNSECNAACPS